MIAPFWADVDTRGSAPQISYGLDATKQILTVTWQGVDHYDVTADGHVPQHDSFQLQLYDRGGGGNGVGDDFDIVFRYQSLQWDKGDASSEAAHAGWTAGDQHNFFELHGSGTDSILGLASVPGNTQAGTAGLWEWQVRGGNIGIGDIAIGAYNFSGDPSHGAFDLSPPFLTPGTPSTVGDFWLNNNNSNVQNAALGNFGYLAMIHELGHSLGLAHPFSTANNQDGDPFNSAYDESMTVMSYNVPSAWAGNRPITPMVLDIQAIQSLYGPNLNTRSGGTTYFGPTLPGTTQAYGQADDGLLGPSGLLGDNGLLPNGKPAILTIWDGGGTNWINCSNQTHAVKIDLNPGHSSTIGSVPNNIYLAQLWTDPSTNVQYGWIQNAIGGSGNDTLIGNALNNTFMGGPGNDTIMGGGGHDTAVYNGPHLDYTITHANGMVTVSDRVAGRDGTDQLTNIEFLKFNDGIILADTSDNGLPPAVGVEGLMYNAVGSAAEIIKLVSEFLPAQIAVAAQFGFNAQVYACEALGLAFAFGDENGGQAFANNFGPANTAMPNTTAGDAAFATAAASAIFGSAATANTLIAIQGFVSNWKAFYTSHGLPGVANATANQIDLAARGAAWGDAVGVALANSLGPLPGEVTNFLQDAVQGTAIYSASLSSQPHAAAVQASASASLADVANQVQLTGAAAPSDHIWDIAPILHVMAGLM